MRDITARKETDGWCTTQPQHKTNSSTYQRIIDLREATMFKEERCHSPRSRMCWLISLFFLCLPAVDSFSLAPVRPRLRSTLFPQRRRGPFTRRKTSLSVASSKDISTAVDEKRHVALSSAKHFFVSHVNLLIKFAFESPSFDPIFHLLYPFPLLLS